MLVENVVAKGIRRSRCSIKPIRKRTGRQQKKNNEERKAKEQITTTHEKLPN